MYFIILAKLRKGLIERGLINCGRENNSIGIGAKLSLLQCIFYMEDSNPNKCIVVNRSVQFGSYFYDFVIPMFSPSFSASGTNNRWHSTRSPCWLCAAYKSQQHPRYLSDIFHHLIIAVLLRKFSVIQYDIQHLYESTTPIFLEKRTKTKPTVLPIMIGVG